MDGDGGNEDDSVEDEHGSSSEVLTVYPVNLGFLRLRLRTFCSWGVENTMSPWV